MVRSSERRGFTLVELLVVIAIIAILVLLLLPAVNSAREAARRNGCINNCRQLALSILNHESATRRFPVADDGNDGTTPVAQRMYSSFAETTPNSLGRTQPGQISNSSGQGGYSWIVKVLPYMEEQALYDQVRKQSDRFQLLPFDASMTIDGSNSTPHLAETSIGSLVCPSYAGAEEAPDMAYNGVEAAIATYAATVGSHFDSNNNDLLEENGAMTSGAKSRGKGRTIGGLADGVSKTVLVSESKDEIYGAWIDGQSMWVAATWNGQPTQRSNNFSNQGLPQYENQLPVSALNLGPDPNLDEADQQFYYESFGNGSGVEAHKAWGPSSDHAGGVIVHTFGDGHTSAISDSTDANVVIAVYTSAGGESIPADSL